MPRPSPSFDGQQFLVLKYDDRGAIAGVCSLNLRLQTPKLYVS